MALLRFDALSFAYPHARLRALDEVTLTVNKGEFLLLCGASGCGKTTLLRHAKPELAPVGAREGEVYFCDRLLSEADRETTAMRIGFVQQNPDSQIVTDFVWHELAFGLENMAMPTQAIRRRVAETAAYFGMESWYRHKTHQLSGGQKQLLNLASIMAMQPELILLDEPTSMLDPIAAKSLLEAVRRINRELGVTVLMTEHRLEEVFPLADRVLIMEDGRLTAADSPRCVASRFSGTQSRFYYSLPSAVRIFGQLGARQIPLTAGEGRAALAERLDGKRPDARCGVAPAAEQRPAKPVLSAKELWFRYEEKGQDVLRGASLVLNENELLCLLGGNGAGKSTLLALLCKLLKPYRGKIAGHPGRKAALLPQDPQALFCRDSVRDELLFAAAGPDEVRDVAERLELTPLLDRHPYDLSGGEMQRAALAKLLLTKADVLLLDEPTKGLDACAKRTLGAILHELVKSGASILAVTHDIEFAAQYANRCALLFDGQVLCQEEPHAFFSGNRYYTTAANRIAADHFPDAITCEEVVRLCRACS